ncbi:hypothetical protein FQZ97_756550 [compost metagenome]
MLGPAADLGLDPAPGQRRLQALDGAGDEGLAFHPLFLEQTSDLLVLFGLQEAERQIFHFPFDLPDSQPVGQGRVQVQGFPGEGDGARRLAFRVPAQAAQPGRQPHQHNAQVGRHGQQHFALHLFLRAGFGLGVAGLPGHHAQPQQSVRALHQPRDLGAEGGRDRVIAQGRRGRHQIGRQGGQQGRRPRRGIGMQGRQDPDHASAVPDQGLARERVLPVETRFGPGDGLIDQRPAVGIQANPYLLAPGGVERRRRVENRRGGHDGRERSRLIFRHSTLGPIDTKRRRCPRHMEGTRAYVALAEGPRRPPVRSGRNAVPHLA